MKKLLFFLFAIALLSSCEPMAKDSKDIVTIPTEIYQSLKVDTIPVTMYVYEYDEYVYYFNEKKEVMTVHYTGKAIHGDDAFPMILAVIVLSFMVAGMIFSIIEKH